MKKIKEYQMMLNENRIPYLETQKSFLCESKCNSPANVANIMESCFRISDLPEEHIYAIALNTKNQITGIFEVGKGTVNCSLISAREILKMLKTKKEATKSTQETRNIKKIEVLKPELSLEKASNISHLPLPSVRQQPDCYAPLP